MLPSERPQFFVAYFQQGVLKNIPQGFRSILDSITQWLQVCQLHIYDVNLPFHHILKVRYWIELW